jgi:hypothetical protein
MIRECVISSPFSSMSSLLLPGSWVREIDLDEKRFIIRERSDNLPDTKVFFEIGLIEEAKMPLDHRIRVEASRGTGQRRRLRALVIEIAEDEGS